MSLTFRGHRLHCLRRTLWLQPRPPCPATGSSGLWASHGHCLPVAPRTCPQLLNQTASCPSSSGVPALWWRKAPPLRPVPLLHSSPPLPRWLCASPADHGVLVPRPLPPPWELPRLYSAPCHWGVGGQPTASAFAMCLLAFWAWYLSKDPPVPHHPPQTCCHRLQQRYQSWYQLRWTGWGRLALSAGHLGKPVLQPHPRASPRQGFCPWRNCTWQALPEQYQSRYGAPLSCPSWQPFWWGSGSWRPVLPLPCAPHQLLRTGSPHSGKDLQPHE